MLNVLWDLWDGLESLRWRHNEHDGVSNHQPHDCLLNHFFSGANQRKHQSADQRKHQSSASLAFVRGIHRWPVNSPHKGPVTWKTFPFDDVIMVTYMYSMGDRAPAALPVDCSKIDRKPVKLPAMAEIPTGEPSTWKRKNTATQS